ncbi:MAG: TolC family protein [Acidobacteria bacterium]|nr:TolC family protein [Acidobacteriota bacterium]
MSILFAVLAALASGTAATPASEPITLPQAERLLAERGFDLLVAQANALGAEGDLLAQSASPNPTFSGSGLYSRAVPQAQFATTPGYSVGISDNAALFDALWGKKLLRHDAAAAALGAARAGKDDALRNLRFQLESAFIGALLARDNLRFAEDVLATYQDTLQLNQARYEQGAIGIADVARVATAKGEAEQAVEQARAAMEQARAGLLIFLGKRDQGVLLEPRGDLAYRGSAAPGTRIEDFKTLLDDASSHRPDLRVAAANRQQAERALALARRLRLPDLTLSAGYNTQVNLKSNPPTVVSPPDYTLSLSLPIPVFYRQQGEIQRAEMNLRAAQALEDKAHAQVAADVLTAMAGLTAARRQIERMEKELLGNARTARDAEKILYEKGAASLLDFLDAERTFVATNVEHRQDLANYWTAVSQLRQATGDLSPFPFAE